MSGFFKEEAVANPGAGDPWMKSERDKALDEYFAGAHPKELGIKYKGAAKAFQNSILNKLKYNFKKTGHEDEPGRAERYEPWQRVSRKGKRLTPNEHDLIRAHAELKLPVEVTAKILMRDVKEIDGSATKGTLQTNLQKQIAPTLDLIWAHRYLHENGLAFISDEAYDDLVKEEIEFGGGEKVFVAIKNHPSLPERIRCLATYLRITFEQNQLGTGKDKSF